MGLYFLSPGANWMARKFAGNAKSCIEIIQDVDKFEIKLLSMFMTREEKFTVGEAYEQPQHDGAISKVDYLSIKMQQIIYQFNL